MNKNREREKERLKQDGVEAEEDENLYEKKITQKLLSKETTMPWKVRQNFHFLYVLYYLIYIIFCSA